jgi:DNA repair photolyase
MRPIYKPKRVIVTPSSNGKEYTKTLLHRIKKLNPSVEIIYSDDDQIQSPSVENKLVYLKETLVLTERKGKFISTFESPGAIVEDMTTVVSLNWHCAMDCEYCYLNNSISRVQWQYIYTNVDRIVGELKVEKYVQWVLRTIWSLYNEYSSDVQTKISSRFFSLADTIRIKNFKQPIIKDKTSALVYINTRLEELMNGINPNSSTNSYKEIKNKLIAHQDELLGSENKTVLKIAEMLNTPIQVVSKADNGISMKTVQDSLDALRKVVDQNSDLSQLQSLKKTLKNAKSILEKIDDISAEDMRDLRSKLADHFKASTQVTLTLLPMEYTDSFAIDHIDDNLLTFFKLMEKHPEFEIQLATKYPHVENLVEKYPHTNVRISVNFNPPKVIEQYERGTYSLEDRIKAVKLIQAKSNWRIRILMEPIILIDDYEQEYDALVHKLMKEIGSKQIDSICIGSMRMGPRLRSRIKQYFPNTDLIDEDKYPMDKPVFPDTKWRYKPETRADIYKKVIAIFGEYSMDHKVVLGAETSSAWDDIGLVIPK